jgi:hypothetical protein
MLIDDVTDLHVHGSPSLVARHASDADTVAGNASVGVSLSVLKAHEGSTAERALLVGDGAVGGVVLNSIVGGANPDAVEVAARLGGRVVWLPTISAPAHRGVELREVPVVVDGRLDPPWHEVLEVVAAHDLVLASGHLTCAEALVLFAEARAHGVRRLLFNHPVLPFLDWDAAAAPRLAELGVNLELSILPDLLVDGRGPTSHDLAVSYPTELLVFGGDLGHADHPTLREALPSWLGQLASRLGDTDTEAIMTGNGRRLVTA